MARYPLSRPGRMHPPSQAIHRLAHDLLPLLNQEAKQRPLIAQDFLAQAMACIDLSLAALLTDPAHRNRESVRIMSEYLHEQGNDMLDSIEKHGYDNPPRDPDGMP